MTVAIRDDEIFDPFEYFWFVSPMLVQKQKVHPKELCLKKQPFYYFIIQFIKN